MVFLENAITVVSKASCPLAFVLQDVQSGVGVREVDEAMAVHEEISGLDDVWRVRTRVDHASRGRRHIVSDLRGAERIANVVHPYASIEISREDQVGTLEGARPVLVQVVRPELPALFAVVDFVRYWQGGNRNRICGMTYVDDPDARDAISAVDGGRLVRDDQKLAVGKGQGGVRPAREWWAPVQVTHHGRACEIADVVDRHSAVAPGCVG